MSKVIPKRSNRDGQSLRAASGERWEKEVESWLSSVLEFVSGFELVEFDRQASEFKHIKHRPKPDYGIRRAGTQNDWIIFVGCKKSLRERWAIDDRHAGILKEHFPQSLYIEVTADTSKDIKNCDDQRRWMDGVFNSEKATKNFVRSLLT